MPAEPEFLSDDVLRIGTTRFRFHVPLSHVPPGHLGIEKTRRLLQSYFELWEDVQPRFVVELGIRQGGSTAMLCELGVDRVVSIELSETRIEALDAFVAERGAQDVVHPHYGVDQGDRTRVAEIVTREFGEVPLDLVIDDASHLYDESVASFEVLYPRLRPGGWYLLEDWRWHHMFADRMTAELETSDEMRQAIEARMIAEDRAGPDTPMSRMVLELMIARAIDGAVVEEIRIGTDWAAVRRGPAELDPETFRLGDWATDHFQLLTPRP